MACEVGLDRGFTYMDIDDSYNAFHKHRPVFYCIRRRIIFTWYDLSIGKSVENGVGKKLLHVNNIQA